MSPSETNNPLLIHDGIPAFDRIKPEHVEPGITQMLERAQEILTRIEDSSSASWDELMTPMNEIDLLFEYGWSPVTHLMSVATSDELRAAHDAVLPRVVEFGLRMRQSDSLYRIYCGIRDAPEWSTLNNAQQRIVTKAIQQAELSGIALTGKARAEFNEIEQELSQLNTQFANNVLDATKAWKLDLTDADDIDGFPQSLKRLCAAAWSNADENKDKQPATPDAGPWRITLDIPCFGPFMEHCRKPELRERVYRQYIQRAASGDMDNTPLIARILKLRRRKSELLGFRNYAELSLSTKMADDAEAVHAMSERLRAAAFDAAKNELAEVTAFANSNGHEGELRHWDVAFWAERLREERYAFTDEELRPYFSLDRVLAGLFELCERLFGVHVRAADGKAPVWHPDVRYFEVDNEAGQSIAAFFLDPYSRPSNKRGGAWMNDCIGRSVVGDQTRLPVAHLVCNSTPPTGDVPSLMTFREVETLFHEFGHGLQHMLTTVNERDAAGINGVEWDAVELPSQFMENWCYHRPTLMSMAVHYQTGELLPDDLYRKLCAARHYRAASQLLRQLQFGLTDMALHSTFDPDADESAFDVERRIAETTSVLPPLPENRFLCSFQHIFAGGYAAGYYSYKWAEVLSADAFAAFEAAGLDDETAIAETGRKFRDTILSLGGSQHPMDVFRQFRGREPDPDALLRQCGLLNAAG
jgi:oligopeptidase A